MDIGYARVSTGEQTLDLQLDALTDGRLRQGLSGDRQWGEGRAPVLTSALLSTEGDTLVVWRLDRLGRSLRHLIEVVAAARGAGDRLQESDRADRHHHAGGQADLPRLRGAGRVRARPHPGADPCRLGRGAGARTTGGPAEEAGRSQAARAGPDALRGGQTDIATICAHPRHLPGHALPLSQGAPRTMTAQEALVHAVARQLRRGLRESLTHRRPGRASRRDRQRGAPPPPDRV